MTGYKRASFTEEGKEKKNIEETVGRDPGKRKRWRNRKAVWSAASCVLLHILQSKVTPSGRVQILRTETFSTNMFF